eukprot:gene9574-2886_t
MAKQYPTRAAALAMVLMVFGMAAEGQHADSGPHLALETITLPAREDGSAGHVIYTVPDFASKEERAALIAASNAALENNEIANTEICEPKPDEIGTALAFLAKVPIATKMTETLLERLLSLVEDQLPEMAHLLFAPEAYLCTTRVYLLAALAESLNANTALTTLSIGGNAIANEGAAALADVLKTNRMMTTLSLGGNSIGASGAIAIAEALKTNSMLTSLDLGGNSIPNEGALALADALKTNAVLTTLYLDSNLITDEACDAFVDALKINTVLTWLELKYNSINEGSANIDSIEHSLAENADRNERAAKEANSKA